MKEVEKNTMEQSMETGGTKQKKKKKKKQQQQ